MRDEQQQNRREDPHPGPLPLRGRGGRSAFTLIELMVVIGIVGILMALVLPALRGARGAALQTVALSNVRSVGQLMNVYSADHGRHPYRGLGEYPASMLEIFPDFQPQPDAAMYQWYPGGVLIGTTGHFEQAWLWPSIVAPLDEWPEHWETWVSPRKDRPLPTQDDFDFSEDNPIRDQISVRYSNAFVARPEYFGERRGATEEAMLRQLRATRPSDVRFPSSKVMLWDNDLSYRTDVVLERVGGLLDADTPMFFADGHGASRNPTEATEAVENPMAEDGTMKLGDTKDGVQGRDY